MSRLETTLKSRRPKGEDDQEGWLVAYADLITLLFIFFSLILSISVVSRTKFEAMTTRMNSSSVTSLAQLKEHLDNEIESRELNKQVSTQIHDEGLEIHFKEGILFPSGQANINPGGRRVLARFAKLLTEYENDYKLAIEGHTDDRPIRTAQFPSNWALSSARSVSVLHLLKGQGLDDRKMVVRGYADTRPARSESESVHHARSLNRRVTLLVY